MKEDLKINPHNQKSLNLTLIFWINQRLNIGEISGNLKS